jgi:hypothetical protein
MAGYTINSAECLMFPKTTKTGSNETPSNDWNLVKVARLRANSSSRASRLRYGGVASIVPFDPRSARTGSIINQYIILLSHEI